MNWKREEAVEWISERLIECGWASNGTHQSWQRDGSTPYLLNVYYFTTTNFTLQLKLQRNENQIKFRIESNSINKPTGGEWFITKDWMMIDIIEPDTYFSMPSFRWGIINVIGTSPIEVRSLPLKHWLKFIQLRKELGVALGIAKEIGWKINNEDSFLYEEQRDCG